MSTPAELQAQNEAQQLEIQRLKQQNEVSQLQVQNAQQQAELAALKAQAPTAQTMIPAPTAPPADPLTSLAKLAKCRVSQVVQGMQVAMELLVGFNMADKYVVKDPAGEDLFYAYEDDTGFGMGMITRQMFDGGSRPFDMTFGVPKADGSKGLEGFAKCHRPFAFNCCCLGQQPEMDIFVGQDKVGRVRDPWACCALTYEGYDQASGSQTMAINMPARFGCCPAACCFGCCSGEFRMSVTNPQTQQEIASITKVFGVGDFIADYGTYDIDFGQITDVSTKVMLISLCLFVDYSAFSSGGQQTRDNSLLGRANDGGHPGNNMQSALLGATVLGAGASMMSPGQGNMNFGTFK